MGYYLVVTEVIGYMRLYDLPPPQTPVPTGSSLGICNTSRKFCDFELILPAHEIHGEVSTIECPKVNLVGRGVRRYKGCQIIFTRPRQLSGRSSECSQLCKDSLADIHVLLGRPEQLIDLPSQPQCWPRSLRLWGVGSTVLPSQLGGKMYKAPNGFILQSKVVIFLLCWEYVGVEERGFCDLYSVAGQGLGNGQGLPRSEQ